MSSPSPPPLLIVPGTLLVLFFVQVDATCTVLAVNAGRFMDGLKASCALLSFGAVHRDDERLDELLPWAGNV